MTGPRLDSASDPMSRDGRALVERLANLYRALSRTNSAIAHAETEPALLAEMCAIAVEHGHFVLAAIGLLDADGHVRTRAAAGPAVGYGDGLQISAHEADPVGGGPGGRAVRGYAHVICNRFQEDPRNAPWLERARAYGIRASAGIPLIHDGTVIGLLSVYSDEVDVFGPYEVALLDDMAGNIAQGIEKLAGEAALRRASREQARLLDQLHAIERTVRAGVFRVVLPDWDIWWSSGVSALLALPAGVEVGWEALQSRLSAAGVTALRNAIADAAQSGAAVDIDLELRGDGAPQACIRFAARVADHGTAGIEAAGIVQDISELRALVRQVDRVTVAERERLVADLHDNLGQVLTASAWLASSLEKDVRAKAPALADAAAKLAAAVSDAQRLCRDLSHSLLDDDAEGLGAALARLAAQVSRADISCRSTVTPAAEAALSRQQRIECYRVVQEAVTNALKHAGCRQIAIEATYDGGVLVIAVRDDGVGIAGHAGSGGIGLRTMRYRAGRIGATVTVGAGVDGGTCVRLTLPLAGPSRQDVR